MQKQSLAREFQLITKHPCIEPYQNLKSGQDMQTYRSLRSNALIQSYRNLTSFKAPNSARDSFLKWRISPTNKQFYRYIIGRTNPQI